MMRKDAKKQGGRSSRSPAGPAHAAAAGAPEPGPGARGRFLRYLLVILFAGSALFAWLSVLSYCPYDPPASNVYPPPAVRNIGGPVGAYLAYALRYWLGPGAYALLLFATISAGILLLGGRVAHWPWRLAGVGLMVTTMSAGAYLVGPHGSQALLEGNVLGVTVGEFLLRAFSKTGSWLVVLAAFGVGLMFAADELVLRLPAMGRKVLRRRAAGREDLRHLPAAPRVVAAAPARPRPAERIAEEKKPPPPKPAAPPAAAPAPPKGEAVVKAKRRKHEGYERPSLSLLADPPGEYQESQEALVLEKRRILQQTLDDFAVDAQAVGHMTGPVISMFELSLAPGVKVSQISSLAPDIARALAVPGVRVVSPLPGRDTVGIEVPNMDKEIVRLKELMDLAPDASERMQIPLYLGKDAGGRPIVADLTTMPHLLLAGTTGSGKSVCINSIISAILMTRSPEQVRLILIDPKMVEMAAFERIPHLLCPIVHDMQRAEAVLEWAATRMDERYELLKEAGVRNIASYNRLGAREIYRRFGAEGEEERAQIPTSLPYYVIIIDELADLIMTSSKDVENHIIRIAQKARAVGIHLVVATQRPSVNVVTGLIKSNMPCRISFRVASRQESRIILDQNGADVLLGQGDMLFLQPGTSHLVRAQGTYVDESEVRALVDFVRGGGEPEFDPELVRIQSGRSQSAGGQRDELFDQAVEIVLTTRRGSVSLLQRRLSIGYSRASRIVDQMAEAGILGDYKGSQARECLMTLEEWRALKANIQADQSGVNAADGTPTSV